MQAVQKLSNSKASILTLFSPMLIQDIFDFLPLSLNSCKRSDLGGSSLFFFSYMTRHFVWLNAE